MHKSKRLWGILQKKYRTESNKICILQTRNNTVDKRPDMVAKFLGL